MFGAVSKVLIRVLAAPVISRKMSTQLLSDIFMKSVESVRPRCLIRKALHVKDRHLSVNNHIYPVIKPCYLVGFGKAVWGMALEAEAILGDLLQMGIVTVPLGTSEKFDKKSSKINFIEGAKNNIPDERAVEGAVEIKNLAQGLGADDLLLVLISGGGSALLPLPKPPITLQEKQDIIVDLAGRGADILELNTVRKRISTVKGGGLAEAAYPATVISLILSDIVGDALDFIASGPTTPNSERPEDAIKIIKKYMAYDRLPLSIRSVLEGAGESDQITTDNNSGINSRPSIVDGKYGHVQNYVVGNNLIAAEAARRHAISLGLQSAILSTTITGDVRKIGRIYAQLARNLARIISNSSTKQNLPDLLKTCDLPGLNSDSVTDEIASWDFSKGLCLVGAGEPTVVVNGTGTGGRNQQLALAFSVELNKLNVESADISFLSAGTDGIDGPTDAAGAIGTLDLVNNSRAENIKPEDYLDNNDSYGFYSEYRGGSHLIKVGHTGTNVMDIHLLMVKPK